jgi:hypothetical protein
MATVTGFTAERMLEIENSTVVDGNVVGNNLILLTRDGTQIDAGNVRGPQGVQGVPGPVQSINDQTGSVYSPRFFTNKTALDAGWGTAPDGAQAYTTADETNWVRDQGLWKIAPPHRVFANKAAIDSEWATAPDGATAYTTTDQTGWYRVAGVWVVDPPSRIFTNKTALDAGWTNPPAGARAYTTADQLDWYRFGTIWVASQGFRRFAAGGDLLAGWTNPPIGARSWVGPYTGPQGDRGLDFIWRNNGWYPKGVMVVSYANRTTIGADASWVNVNIPNHVINLNGGYDGWGWYPPHQGLIKVSSELIIGCGTALGASDHNAWHQVATDITSTTQGTQATMSSQAFTGGQYNCAGSAYFNVTQSDVILIRAYVAGAAGMYKTLFEGSNIMIEYV